MSLQLVIGPMFSGKSSYLLSSIQRYKEINWPTFVITSVLDKRYSEETKIINHNKDYCMADIAVENLFDAMIHAKFLDAKVVIVEEAQFYSNLVDFIIMAVDVHKKHVIVAGLDGDVNREPFGDVLKLVPHADSIIKLKALCKRCNDGTEALFTFKKSNNTSVVDVGGSDKYEALCRKHYIIEIA